MLRNILLTILILISIKIQSQIAYVANSQSDNVSVISLDNNSIITTIPVGSYPFSVMTTHDGTKVYVSNYNSNTISVISTISNTLENTIQVGERPMGMVKDMLPADIDGYEPIGLNERFRFYRYKDGQQFKPHVDGSFRRSETETSKITLLIYLNEDFEGGNTTLVLEGEEIKPKEGMLFLFEHRIMHCGRPVTEGTKYVLRTDVMYKLKEAE